MPSLEAPSSELTELKRYNSEITGGVLDTAFQEPSRGAASRNLERAGKWSDVSTNFDSAWDVKDKFVVSTHRFMALDRRCDLYDIGVVCELNKDTTTPHQAQVLKSNLQYNVANANDRSGSTEEIISSALRAVKMHAGAALTVSHSYNDSVMLRIENRDGKLSYYFDRAMVDNSQGHRREILSEVFELKVQNDADEAALIGFFASTHYDLLKMGGSPLLQSADLVEVHVRGNMDCVIKGKERIEAFLESLRSINIKAPADQLDPLTQLPTRSTLFNAARQEKDRGRPGYGVSLDIQAVKFTNKYFGFNTFDLYIKLWAFTAVNYFGAENVTKINFKNSDAYRSGGDELFIKTDDLGKLSLFLEKMEHLRERFFAGKDSGKKLLTARAELRKRAAIDTIEGEYQVSVNQQGTPEGLRNFLVTHYLQGSEYGSNDSLAALLSKAGDTIKDQERFKPLDLLQSYCVVVPLDDMGDEIEIAESMMRGDIHVQKLKTKGVAPVGYTLYQPDSEEPGRKLQLRAATLEQLETQAILDQRYWDLEHFVKGFYCGSAAEEIYGRHCQIATKRDVPTSGRALRYDDFLKMPVHQVLLVTPDTPVYGFTINLEEFGLLNKVLGPARADTMMKIVASCVRREIGSGVVGIRRGGEIQYLTPHRFTEDTYMKLIDLINHQIQLELRRGRDDEIVPLDDPQLIRMYHKYEIEFAKRQALRKDSKEVLNSVLGTATLKASKDSVAIDAFIDIEHLPFFAQQNGGGIEYQSFATEMVE